VHKQHDTSRVRRWLRLLDERSDVLRSDVLGVPGTVPDAVQQRHCECASQLRGLVSQRQLPVSVYLADQLSAGVQHRHEPTDLPGHGRQLQCRVQVPGMLDNQRLPRCPATTVHDAHESANWHMPVGHVLWRRRSRFRISLRWRVRQRGSGVYVHQQQLHVRVLVWLATQRYTWSPPRRAVQRQHRPLLLPQ